MKGQRMTDDERALAPRLIGATWAKSRTGMTDSEALAAVASEYGLSVADVRRIASDEIREHDGVD
jgi:hypothetical protein